MTQEQDRRDKLALGELAEDAAGFGVAELHLTRDLLIRPRAAMAAYDAEGSTAGGRYPRPLRYYLTLNGVYLLLLTFTGGLERTFDQSGSDEMIRNLASWAGKSLDETRADLDQWFSLLMVPIYTLTFAWPLYRLIRRWSPADNRTDFNQTFTFLSLWTLYGLPFGLLIQFYPPLGNLGAAVSFLLIPIAYAVIGRGRWWRTRRGAWLKGIGLVVASVFLMVPVALLTWALAVAAVKFLP